MIHDNPYDQAEADGAAEDRRQARADQADEDLNERRQLAKLDRLFLAVTGKSIYSLIDDCISHATYCRDLVPNHSGSAYQRRQARRQLVGLIKRGPKLWTRS